MTEHFYQQLVFPDSRETRPFVALNMVASLDGKVTSGGTLRPGSIGSSFDRQTMNILRSHFDAILAGGHTIRQHPFYLGVPKEMEVLRTEKGLAPQPLTVLLTNSANLDPLSPLFQNPPRPPIILTSKAGAQALPTSIRKQTSVEALDDQVGIVGALALLLEKYKVKRLLLEGGPNVNYQFFQHKFIDEVFLTLAPKLVGNATDFSMVMGEGVLPSAKAIHLRSVHKEGDELFLRYGILWD